MKANQTPKDSPKTITGFSAADALVSQWEATEDEAKAVYRSWVQALRRRDDTKNMQVSERELLLESLQKTFWMPYPDLNIPISKRFQELADAISDLEMAGENFSMGDFKTIVKEPPSIPGVFRDWFLRHWIIPVNVGDRRYPLCICTSNVIARLYKMQMGLRKEDTGASIRQEIRILKLERPKSSPLLRMQRFEQENPPEEGERYQV